MSDLVPPALRGSVKIGKLVQRGELSYVLKEPDKQAYYHFTDAQYQMMILFDGNRDIEQLVSLFNRNSSQYEFDAQALEPLVQSCREYQLLQRSKAEQNAALLEKIRDERKKKMLQGQGSLLFLRFQLVDPNRLFNKIINPLRFLWHPKVIRIQAIFMVVALLAALFQGERFFNDFNRVYLQAHEGSLGIFSIWLIALATIAVHECGHGLTCKHYGGDVNEMGFLLLAFQPCLYCNVNDAWLFDNKWQKINVALAGVWVELLLAAFAVFVWLLIDVANPIGFIAFVVFTIVVASSLLVNLNPLLKFDGYYVLTDWLEIQNLRQNAFAWLSYKLKTRVFKLEEEAPFSASAREQKVYLIYGAMAAIYMAMMLSFIALIGYSFVSAQLGFMANIAFIVLVFMIVKHLTGSWIETMTNWFKSLLWQNHQRKRNSLIGLIALSLLFAVWHPKIRISATGTTEALTQVIYAPESGYITSLAYNQNRQLTGNANTPLLTLTSPDLLLAQQKIDQSLNLLSFKRQEASAMGDVVSNGQLTIEQALAEEQQTSLLAQNASLVISKPQGDWLVEGLPPESMQGRFFSAGTPILNLIAQKQRLIDVIVDQRDIGLLSTGDEARVRFAGVAPAIYPAQIEQIGSVAKLEGIEQSVLVRMTITANEDRPIPPVGLSADVLIFGQPTSVWGHILHQIRKVLRADLWL